MNDLPDAHPHDHEHDHPDLDVESCAEALIAADEITSQLVSQIQRQDAYIEHLVGAHHQLRRFIGLVAADKAGQKVIAVGAHEPEPFHILGEHLCNDDRSACVDTYAYHPGDPEDCFDCLRRLTIQAMVDAAGPNGQVVEAALTAEFAPASVPDLAAPERAVTDARQKEAPW